LSHPPDTVVHVQAGPNGTQEGADEMADHEPLRISCDGCPGGCDDCLVEFFTAERDARVVRLDGDESARSRPKSRRPLDAELQRALGTLAAAGLEPMVLAVRPNRRGVSRAS
jgi:hypothetical protein